MSHYETRHLQWVNPLQISNRTMTSDRNVKRPQKDGLHIAMGADVTHRGQLSAWPAASVVGGWGEATAW